MSTGLAEQLRTHADRLVYDDADQLESATAEIRRLIEATEFPAALGDEVAAAYRALGEDPFVAVRSSGTAEDTAEASYAGLHDTYLDVRGVDGLIDAVRRCWASLWTSRATGYRHRNGVDHFEAEYFGEDVRKYFEFIGPQFVGLMEASDIQVWVKGETGFVVLKQHYQGKDQEGNDFHWVMRQTDGVVKVDGKWRIAHTHYSWPVTPPPDFKADLMCSPGPHPWDSLDG